MYVIHRRMSLWPYISLGKNLDFEFRVKNLYELASLQSSCHSLYWYLSSLLVVLLGRWGRVRCLVYTRTNLCFKWKIIKQMLTSTTEGQILTQPARQDALHLPAWPRLNRIFPYVFVQEVMDPHDLVPVAPPRHPEPYVIPEPWIHSSLLCPRATPVPPSIFPVRCGFFP